RTLFEAPSVEQLALRIEAAVRAGSGVQTPPLLPVPRTSTLPLSFAQQRLWFLDQLEPGSAFYNVPILLTLRGALVEDVLERSFQELVRRHESLRTVFRAEGGAAVQVILPVGMTQLERVDLSGLPEAERQAEARRRAEHESTRPFNLETGPLLRTTLLKLTPDEHVLVLVLHHIVSDGWSLGVLTREMGALYTAFSQGQPVSLPELPVQYADYAVWQRSWLQGEVLEAQLGYWRKQLSEAPRALELPTDKPRPAVQTFRGATCEAHWPRELWESVKALAQRENATPFMVLLAGFQVVLARYSGQDDIVVGSPIANRTRAETEGLIGFFVNTLVLRARLGGNPTFRELLAQVRDVTLGAYAHQEVPFEKLVEELQPERDMSRSPLFQVLFTLQNAPHAEIALPGLRMEAAGTAGSTSKFDLTLAMGETAQGLSAVLEFNTDLFEKKTAERLLGHLRVLVESAVKAPVTRVDALPLLPHAERQQVLVEWNTLQLHFPHQGTLHGRFEAQAQRTPDAVALSFEGTHLTYRELNSRANQLASWLRANGAGPESRVGLFLERSVELIVGLLGILKAGAAYVPMDPVYPRERLAFMLADSAAPILLTQEPLLSQLPPHSARVLCLDTQWQELSGLPTEDAGSGASEDNLAYVIYTSGSTGQPKGSLIPHAHVLRLFSATEHWYGFGPRDVWTLFHSSAFDFSVWEIWGALLHGGRLVVVPYYVSRSPEAFYALLNQEAVTVLNQTPSAFRQLIQHEQSLPSPLPLGLRYVIFGGEALDFRSLQPWFALHGDSQPRLVNMYGITETTVHVTYRPLSAKDASGGTASVVGVPIPDLQAFILDSSLEPVPVGVPGELYIGGRGLARGYLGRQELTAERFIPHPFSTTPGARLYKTGDRARFCADGQIDYLGRTDFQVKLRGFRIELGEIEAVLEQQPGIRQSLVLAREDRAGDKRLVAYVVPVTGQTVDIAALRQGLKAKLPEYMVPSAFVTLEALPLTSNGKVDRKALPAPDASASAASTYEAPRTPTEQRLAALWTEVLGVERVGVADSFFELGGHSLLATQLVSRIRSTFQVELPLRALFEAPTLSALATRLEVALQEGQGVSQPPLTRASRTEALPLSFAQQRLWFLDRLEPGSPFYNMPLA
ncbi:amino acid adenylation domain-containing protein, partial [Pyxidicoccus sp. 3LFB2]